MDDRIDLVVLEDLAHALFVQHIGAIKPNVFAGDHLNSCDGLHLGVHQIVHYDHRIACVGQCHAGMASDKTGTAGYQNFSHDTTLPLLASALCSSISDAYSVQFKMTVPPTGRMRRMWQQPLPSAASIPS